MDRFKLDSRLESASAFITDLGLCQARLHKNINFPWILLIPREPDVKELTDLNEDQQIRLMKEISKASKVMQSLFCPDKMNVATLGNIVSQLHIHVIARFINDPAWPHAVWGYDEKIGLKAELDKMIAQIKPLLLG